MATTFVDYTGDGNATKQFSFPSIKEADIKVDVDGVIKTSGNHYNITSYSTTGGGNVVFTSGNIPASPAAIRIFRDTDVDAAKATFVAGSSVKAGDLNNNMTQILYAAQEEQNQTLLSSDIKDGAVKTVDIADLNVTTAKIAADAVTGAKIADDQINSEHYVDGSIDTAHIADSQITTAKIADSNVTTAKIADSNVTTTKIANDAINGTKIADDSINSEHYVDGSIDTAHIGNSQVTTAKIADSNVTTAKIAADAITGAKIADDAINSEHYTDGSIDTAHIADLNVTTAKIAADAVTNAKIADDSIDSEHYVDGSIDTAHIGNSQVTTAKIAADNITNALIADDQIDSEHYVDGSIDTAHIGSAQVTDAKLASNSVTTSKITDANVTTVKIADNAVDIQKLGCQQNTITDSDSHVPTSGAVVDYVAAQIAPLGGLEVVATEVAFPNTQPASGVVISISDAGGVVFNGSGVSTTGRTVGGSTVTINGAPSSLYSETLAAGVGLMVSSTGSSQTYNYHKILGKESDIKQLSDDINDFAERYRVGSSNPTSSLNAGDLFFNTGSSKLLVYNSTNSAWEETQTVGNFFINTISSSSGTGGGSATFNGSAYRFTISNAGTYAQQHIVSINGVVQKPNTGTSQPSEGFVIDGGDIIFSSAPASGADYFIITVGASVSIGTPSDGTVSTAKLASGAVTTAKLADANVTTAKIADDAVTAAKLASDAVVTASIVNANVTQAKLADQAVNEAKLQISNSPTNGYFLSAQSGNTGGLTWAAVSTDLVADTSPQLGGDLASNGSDILLADNDFVKVGTGNDLTFSHNGTNSFIANNTGELQFQADDVRFYTSGASETHAKFINNGAVELYHNNSKKLETTSSGVEVFGELQMDDANSHIKLIDGARLDIGSGGDLKLYHSGNENFIGAATTGQDLFFKTSVSSSFDTTSFVVRSDGSTTHPDNIKSKWGTGDDLQIFHDGTRSAINNQTGDLRLLNSGNIKIGKRTDAGSGIAETYASFNVDGACELWHDNTKTLETILNGIKIHGGTGEPNLLGTLTITGGTTSDDHQGIAIMPGDSNSQAHIRFGYGSTLKWQWRVPFHSDGATAGMHLYNWNVGADIMKWDNSGVAHGRDFRPQANNTYDLGTSSYRWRNIYTNDLNLSNEGSSNDVDSTWGDWTIQEGESDLFLKNNRSGKKYKFNLTEVS